MADETQSVTPFDFKIGEQYTYTRIEEIFRGLDYREYNFGGVAIIGGNFLTFAQDDNSDKLISFILIGVRGSFVYQCIYSDFQNPTN